MKFLEELGRIGKGKGKNLNKWKEVEKLTKFGI